VAADGAVPLAYNNVEGDGSAALDRAIKRAYLGRYEIVDTAGASGYVEPQPLRGELPSSASDAAGRPLDGYVLAVYIVGADGIVADPVILRTTDERLSKVATDAMSHWRFTPGRVDGSPVATTAAQEFEFGKGGAQGFHTDSVATYQDQAVLLRRLPGREEFEAYVRRLSLVAHNFFVGDNIPGNIDIILVLRPGRAPRAWLMSGRSCDPGALQGLASLIEAVPPVEPREGPVAFALRSTVAGAAPAPAGPAPIPAAWVSAAAAAGESPRSASDTVLEAACRPTP
jgi:hypothetical protein